MSGVILAIGGCRDYDNVEHFNEEMSRYVAYLEELGLTISKICIGDAPGIDSMALDYAIKHDIDYHIEFADWDGIGNSAGMIRNRAVLRPASHFLAFWDGASAGTKGAIALAINLKKSIVRKTIRTTEGRYYSNTMKAARAAWKAAKAEADTSSKKK